MKFEFPVLVFNQIGAIEDPVTGIKNFLIVSGAFFRDMGVSINNAVDVFFVKIAMKSRVKVGAF